MKRFRKIYIEITNICNMNCSFCPKTKRTPEFMSLDKFKYVINEIKAYTDYVYLHVKGEPLLHPKLKEIIDICNENKLQVNISTNGVLLKEKHNSIQGIRQLNVSLHSFEQADEAKHKEYIADILEICNKLTLSGTIIRYKLWNAEGNNGKNKIVLDMLQKMYNVSLESMPYSKDKKLKDNIFLSIKSPFKWPDINDENQKDSKCYGLRNQIAILVDGTVVPCCVDNDGDIALGNIFNEKLEEILNNKRAIDIKTGFENNKCVEKLCKNCEYRKQV